MMPAAVRSAEHDTKSPSDGTWKLVPEKSTSTGPMYKSRTLTITTGEDGTRKFQSEGITADGKDLSGGYEAKLDGKDYPITNHLTGADMSSLRRKSPRETMFTLKKEGKVVNSGTSTVSSDGKTMIIKVKGTGADGKPYTSTGVYEKQ
ncbi:MAG TPA: hypothetical protein VE621_07630 [Bryobacteraceae bacterium]|nr:hypothetical protein [Bryobacteraceae bacterium]